MKTREESTPRCGIRRHVDLVDDHGHSSCQLGFLAAIPRSDVQSLLLSDQRYCASRVTSTTPRAGKTARSCSLSSVFIRTLRPFQSPRWAGKICVVRKILSVSPDSITGVGERSKRVGRGQKLDGLAVNGFPLLESVMAQGNLLAATWTSSSRMRMLPHARVPNKPKSLEDTPKSDKRLLNPRDSCLFWKFKVHQK